MTNIGNLNIAVGFESKSGEAIAVYENDLASTELQYKTWASGTGVWSTGIDFGSFGGNASVGLIVNPNPFSDQIMLVVNDALPSGYSFFSATPSVGTYDSATGEWTIGTLASLGTQTLVLVGTVVGNKTSDTYRNQATVTSGAYDATPSNNSDSAAPSVADLSLTKTVAFADGGDVDDSGSPSAGDILVFTVTVSNSGPDYASEVEVTDLLNSGFAYDSDDSEGTYVPATGIWTVGAIAPGKSRVLNIVVVINASGTYTNVAQVSKARQFDPDSKPGNSVAGEDDQATVTITLHATAVAPVANNDQSLSNPAAAVSLVVTLNDTDANQDIKLDTVDLDPVSAGVQTSITTAEQGTWTVDATGLVTFTPLLTFKSDPTPIKYSGARVSNQATITIDYVPVACDDSTVGNTTGTAVTLNVLTNDTGGDTPVASTVKIVGTNNSGDSLVVPGQGTWSINPTTGAITFTPLAGFKGDPSPIQYTAQDAQGNISAPATVSVVYIREITSSIQARMCGATYNRSTKLYNGIVRLTNIGSSTYSGKVKVVFADLTPGITITGASIDTDGYQYLVFNVSNVGPGAFADMAISYDNPLNKVFSCTLRAFTGAF